MEINELIERAGVVYEDSLVFLSQANEDFQRYGALHWQRQNIYKADIDYITSRGIL
jgi:hypothetical protein